jgi:uncharacterized protein (TIGR01777 family)
MSIKKVSIFEKNSLVDVPVMELFNWHRNPGALERYCPPWDPIKVLESGGSMDPGSRVLLKMKAGPFSYRWLAEHKELAEGESFMDEQIKGPFQEWRHTHLFKAIDKKSSRLTDKIEYRLPLHGLLSRLPFLNIDKKLERIFNYRHRLISGDLKCHVGSGVKPPLKIVISGSSGLIGTALLPFLTTGGHRVIRLVRREPVPGKDESYWDPYKKIIDKDAINGADAVVHLSGDNIGQGPWTDKKKKLIVKSRMLPTSFIAETCASVKKPPGVFMSASAIGYYGSRGDEMITEESGAGTGFLPETCTGWESAAMPAVNKGIRTLFLRLGVVLSPEGGALKRLLLPFSIGAGGRIGEGEQYMSWITIDDLLGALLHLISHKKISGPVNLVSPGPVTNREFTSILSRILKRPAFFHLPGLLIKIVFGEMGRAVLLGSTRVTPKKLLNSGYEFRNPGLEGALRYILGRDNYSE